MSVLCFWLIKGTKQPLIRVAIKISNVLLLHKSLFWWPFAPLMSRTPTDSEYCPSSTIQATSCPVGPTHDGFLALAARIIFWVVNSTIQMLLRFVHIIWWAFPVIQLLSSYNRMDSGLNWMDVSFFNLTNCCVIGMYLSCLCADLFLAHLLLPILSGICHRAQNIIHADPIWQGIQSSPLCALVFHDDAFRESTELWMRCASSFW